MPEDITLHLSFYGNIRDSVGARELEITLAGPLTLRDLVDEMGRRYGKDLKNFIINLETGNLWVHFSVAVNNNLITDLDQILSDGDKVTFLYPVVGG